MTRNRLVAARVLEGAELAEAIRDDRAGIIRHVGWGGRVAKVQTDMQLGRGRRRAPDYGLRRAVWDAAFGYVSGFRVRDIAYFVLTRSLSERVNYWFVSRGR